MSASTRWLEPTPVASGKRGHEPCSSCHEHAQMFRPPFPPKAVRLAFCATCHPGGGTDFSRAEYPPHRTRGASDFWLASFDHGRHQQKDRVGKCESCHALDAGGAPEMRAPKHETCGTASCHGGSQAKPPMSACTACHAPRADQPVAALASTVPTPFRVEEAYSHAQHARVSKKDQCTTCHAHTAVAAGQVVPLPQMISCESCHDGQQAFSAVGTRCQSCHLLSDPPPLTAAAPGRIVVYGHALHAKNGVAPPCETCHFSTPTGELRFPVPRDHQPCAGCHEHEASFRTKDAELCRTCHEHSDPFRKNPLHTRFRSANEFVVALGHASHGAVACATCHLREANIVAVATTRAPLLAPSHAACAKCHATQSQPPMTACASCHVTPGPVDAEAAHWRVRDKFSHVTHTVDVRTAQPSTGGDRTGWDRFERRGAAALPCSACHTGVREAKLGDRIPRPTMEGCATCHQGTLAFKTTGTQCASCHGPVLAAVTP